MIKWRVLTLFSIDMYRITQEHYSVFLYMIVKSTPVFPVFSVGRNEQKFVICLRAEVFTCNILIEYSVGHPMWTLGNRNFIFSGLSFRPTLPSDILFIVQVICPNLWFVRFFDLNKCSEQRIMPRYYLKHYLTSRFALFWRIFFLNSDFLFRNFLLIPTDTRIKWSFGANFI